MITCYKPYVDPLYAVLRFLLFVYYSFAFNQFICVILVNCKRWSLRYIYLRN
jgi:hypothetical protein